MRPHRALWEYATTPTRATLFLRTFLPWQIVRFLIINAKILSMTLRNEGLDK
ncbi:MAG TPA: hypothetical protein VGR96_09310 [Acidobacteriaceae bacterium]|nr:hypothetical protein [Acidobacteriaceae bacterium]